MANKNPLIVFTGLAVAAVAGVLGVTRERWAGDTAQPVALSQPAGSTAVETGSSTSGQSTVTQAAPAETAVTPAAPAEVAAAPAVPQAASSATPTEQPAVAAAQPEAPAVAQPEAPATETPPAAAPAAAPAAPQQVASAQPAAEPAPAQPVFAPAAPVVPTFDTVRVEKTGEAVIAGRAEPNAQVVVLLDGQQVGSTTATADGSFVVVPEKALPPGSGALTIQAKTANEVAALKSDQQVAIMVPEGAAKLPLVAVMTPGAPTKVLQKPAADQDDAAHVTLDAIDYDAQGNILFSGKAAPGAALRLYVDNQALTDTGAGPDGAWTVSSAAIEPGNHMVRVDALDAAGKVTARVELPFTREAASAVAQAETPDAAAPAGTDQPKKGKVVIQPGNNLWRIARVIYGDGRRYTEIFDANKDLIKDPDRIYPGQVFATPKVVPPESIDPARRAPLQPDEAASAQ